MKLQLQAFAWTLSFLVVGLGTLAWYQTLPRGIGAMTNYQLFPLFGILAFSVMWSHYIVGAIRRYAVVDKRYLQTYFSGTAYFVLIMLLLHPGLLLLQLQQDKAGLPLTYVHPDLRIYVVLGMVAWVAFLTYELHRFYGERSWWRYVVIASDIAMILVLIHGFKLSSQLMPSWFTILWVVYGITLVAVIAYGYRARWLNKPTSDKLQA